MKSQTFSIKFKEEVSSETLKRIWEEVRQDLKNKGYRVENIQMPRVKAFVMPYKYFTQTFKELLKSSHVIDESKREYGEWSKASSACIFYSDVNQEWIIIKCEGDPPLEVDLNHELRHLYESCLELPVGSLTTKNAI